MRVSIQPCVCVRDRAHTFSHKAQQARRTHSRACTECDRLTSRHDSVGIFELSCTRVVVDADVVLCAAAAAVVVVVRAWWCGVSWANRARFEIMCVCVHACACVCVRVCTSIECVCVCARLSQRSRWVAAGLRPFTIRMVRSVFVGRPLLSD